ncbi:A-kinase anchor protein 14-like isoform X2 [Coccinella septempunctata]|uniref:A-kinase anchor protein 14-like isoform X2 n=1 Tax=Coccinella septempunctata TaxID=41139 RepID=UPI001D0658AF|nr:A-kinase anchor protein 14-like isoform X2 [Coccinella septempunctata]
MKDKNEITFPFAKKLFDSHELGDEESIEHILLLGLEKPPDDRKRSTVSFREESHPRSAAKEEVEIQESLESLRLCQRLEAIDYKEIDDYAKIFVDEIIDISVGVCEKIEAVLTGGDKDYSYKGAVAAEYEDIEEETSETPRKEDFFPGWPTIAQFSLELAMRRIDQFMSGWRRKEAWKYAVFYVASWSDFLSDFHLFKGMWSIPTKEYPIAQATATIFFSIEVSRVKPKFCLVDVTLQFEGSSSVYRAGQFEFIEQWLFNIIDSKLNLFRTLRF